MSVFICWSGDRSHALAQALKPLLVHSLDLRPDEVFISDNIEKGATWFSSIEKVLDKAQAGIVCLTAENLASPWLHFEAGALGRRLSLLSTHAKGRVRRGAGHEEPRRLFTLLHGIAGSELEGPLSAYQSTLTTKADLVGMVLSLGRVLRRRGTPRPGTREPVIPHGTWNTFAKTAAALAVPARRLIKDLDQLFQRKTFNEPIYRCADQAWLRRYDGARETRDQLGVLEGRV